MATRDELLQAVQTRMEAEGVTATKKDADTWVTAILEAVEDVVMDSTTPLRTPIGSFSAKERAARTGRNPQTGEAIEVPAKVQMTFKQAKARVVIVGEVEKAPVAKATVKAKAPVKKAAAKKVVVKKAKA